MQTMSGIENEVEDPQDYRNKIADVKHESKLLK